MVWNHDIHIYDNYPSNPKFHAKPSIPIIIPNYSDLIIVLDLGSHISDLRVANREKAKNIHKMAFIHYSYIDNSAYNLGNIIYYAIYDFIDSLFSISQ